MSKIGLVLAALLVSACASEQLTRNVGASQVYRIGVIVPLSADGAAYGEPTLRSMTIAAREIEQKTGRKVEFIVEDGLCTTKGGALATQKLIAIDHVSVIIGGMCSSEVLGAAPIAEENHVIFLTPGSNSPDITTAGDYIFRNVGSDELSADKVAQAAIRNGDKRIAIVSEQQSWPQGLRNVFKKHFLALGGTIVLDEEFTSEERDFRSIATKIKSLNPDAIYFVPQTTVTYGAFLESLNELDLDYQMYSGDLAMADTMLTKYKDDIEGTIIAVAIFDEGDAQELLDTYKQEYGSLSIDLPPYFLATAYDSVFIIVEAMDVCGDDADCIRDQLYAIKDRKGAAGQLTIDHNGDAIVGFELKTVRDGSVVNYP